MTPGPAPDHHELPAPTVWPMVTALGVTLLGAALVTHMVVGIVGLILLLVGGAGWWREVLPVERVEEVPLVPLAERASPIVAVSERVEHLQMGEAGHRQRLPVEVQPISAGVKGGLVGGAAMAVVACAYGLAFHGSLWYPINLLSAVAMPEMARADMPGLLAFSGKALGLGFVAHLLVSMLVGVLYAVILPMLPRRHMLWGGLIAPLLWTGLLWGLLGVINPTLNARVNWTAFVISQIAFGLAAGVVVSRAEPVPTSQSLPLRTRAGEGPGRRTR